MARGGPGQPRTLPAQHWEQPFLYFNHAGKQGSWPCFQEKSEVWIFMYTILILILETKLKKKKKKNSGNEISTAMCWNQPSVSAGFHFSPTVGGAVGTEEFNSCWLIYKETECTLNMCVSFLFIKKYHRGHTNQQV